MPGDQRIGRPPLGREFWDIRDFLVKATAPIDGSHETVGIRSAIPTMFAASATAAISAQKAADASKLSAEESEKKIASQTFWGAIGGGVALAALIISLVTLSWNYYSDMDRQFLLVRPEIENLKENLRQTRADLAGNLASVASNYSRLTATQDMLEAANRRISQLEERLIAMSADVDTRSDIAAEPTIAE